MCYVAMRVDKLFAEPTLILEKGSVWPQAESGITCPVKELRFRREENLRLRYGVLIIMVGRGYL